MSETEEGLTFKHGLFLLEKYCDRWRRIVNTTKTIVIMCVLMYTNVADNPTHVSWTSNVKIAHCFI